MARVMHDGNSQCTRTLVCVSMTKLELIVVSIVLWLCSLFNSTVITRVLALRSSNVFHRGLSSENRLKAGSLTTAR